MAASGDDDGSMVEVLVTMVSRAGGSVVTVSRGVVMVMDPW